MINRKDQRFTRRRFMQLTAASAGVAALTACTQVAQPGTSVEAPAAVSTEPVSGGSLVSALPTQGIRGFQTWGDTTGNETHVYTVLYDTFVRYDDEYQLVGGLLESWESADAQTWVFQVRQGVKWHDGVELTSQHFVDYIDTVLDPEAGAASETSDLYADATYQALDDYTLELVLPRQDAALLDGFTAQWLSRTADFDPEQPIGTGPFQFVEWNRNQSIRFARNTDYWQAGLPYLDELTLTMVPDATTRVNLLLTGEVDVIVSVPIAEVGRLEQESSVQLVKTPDEFAVLEYYLLMKSSASPFDDVRVRQAVNYAIDREALLGTTFGYGGLKSNPIGAGSWAFNPNAKSYNQRDLEQAKALMAEAGYTEGEEAFAVTFKYWQEWPENLQIGQIVQANLAEIGITVELQLLEIGQWVDSVIHEHEYEMALTALIPRWDPNDQFGNVYRTDDGQALEWENEEFDTYWEAGRATADIEQRKEAYWKAQEIAMEEVPAAILNSGAAFDAASNSVHNLTRFNRGDLFYERAWVTK